jgi:formate dehydrogenase subunit gamma
MARDPNLLERYSAASRLAHWAVAIAYVLLFLSGLALFHPYFYWLSLVWGGGAFMRIMHPFLGVALAVLFFFYALRLWRDNLLVPSDREWLDKMLDYMNKKAEVRVEGKYNAGQKLMYWSMVPIIAVLLLTGIVLWQPYFAPSFSTGLRRAAGLLHAIASFIMFVGIGVHVYAAYWTKGSIRSMVRGTVSAAWARFHHPAWYREVTEKKP